VCVGPILKITWRKTLFGTVYYDAECFQKKVS
jgi:hypothetical protein